jgi:hypothetical protein
VPQGEKTGRKQADGARGSATVPLKLLSCNLSTQDPLARNLHSNKFRGTAGILD